MERQTFLVLISLILITINLGIIVFLMWRDEETVTPIRTCPTGNCAVNKITGEKRCPGSTGETITLNSDIEGCTDPYKCEDQVVPYAVLADGSTNLLGMCDPGTICRCSRSTICPHYIFSRFDATGEKFLQVATPPPISYDNPSISYCFLSPQLISRALPGCHKTTTIQDFVDCMGIQNGCTPGLTGSACLNGNLAFISEDPYAINVSNTIVGCVGTTGCPCGYVNIWVPSAAKGFCIKPENINNNKNGLPSTSGSKGVLRYDDVDNKSVVSHQNNNNREINKLRDIMQKFNRFDPRYYQGPW